MNTFQPIRIENSERNYNTTGDLLVRFVTEFVLMFCLNHQVSNLQKTGLYECKMCFTLFEVIRIFLSTVCLVFITNIFYLLCKVSLNLQSFPTLHFHSKIYMLKLLIFDRSITESLNVQCQLTQRNFYCGNKMGTKPQSQIVKLYKLTYLNRMNRLIKTVHSYRLKS